MFTKTTFFYLVVLLLISCSGEISPYEYYSRSPIILNGQIDIDGNGFFDVSIEKTSEKLAGKTVKTFKVTPLNDSRILFKSRFGADILHFGDTVYSEVSIPHYWSQIPSYLARQTTTGDKYWIGLWAGQTGYLGLKIKRRTEYHCAWMYMRVDTLKENYEIYNTRYSLFSNKDLVINQ